MVQPGSGIPVTVSHSERRFTTTGNTGLWIYEGEAAARFNIAAQVSAQPTQQTSAMCVSLFKNGSMIPSTTNGGSIEDTDFGGSLVATNAIVVLFPGDIIEGRLMIQVTSVPGNLVLYSSQFIVFQLVL